MDGVKCLQESELMKEPLTYVLRNYGSYSMNAKVTDAIEIVPFQKDNINCFPNKYNRNLGTFTLHGFSTFLFFE